MKNKNFRSGFIAIIGKPNVGKSTFVNYVIGEKISIVSKTPQTTRFHVIGIKTTKNYQLIFADTPGFHESKHLLGKKLIKYAKTQANEADILIFMLDGSKSPDDMDFKVFSFLKLLKDKEKVYLVLNKIDKSNTESLKIVSDEFNREYKFKKTFFISAVTGENIDLLEKEIITQLSDTVKYFPDDMVTDKDIKTRISEIIREKAIISTRHEIPHSIAVTVETMREGNNKDITYIEAIIYTEKDSQKKILIGKNGNLLKKIGTLSRASIQKLLNKKVFLDLRVKDKKDWRMREDFLNTLGYE